MKSRIFHILTTFSDLLGLILVPFRNDKTKKARYEVRGVPQVPPLIFRTKFRSHGHHTGSQPEVQRIHKSQKFPKLAFLLNF